MTPNDTIINEESTGNTIAEYKKYPSIVRIKQKIDSTEITLFNYVRIRYIDKKIDSLD